MKHLSLITVPSLFIAIATTTTMHAANIDPAAQKAETTLQQISGQIRQISEAAFQMSMQSRNPSYAAVQGSELNHMSDDINRVGRELQALDSERALLPAWETKAIDTITPTLHNIATESTDAIGLFNKSQAQLFASNYSAETGRIASEAEDTAMLLNNDLMLEKARAKEANLEHLTNSDSALVQGQ